MRNETKFKIAFPKDVIKAKKFDKENRNYLWYTAIKKELEKVRIAFLLLQNNEKPLPGSKLINYHFVFDVKMDLTRKVRLVAVGNLNKKMFLGM